MGDGKKIKVGIIGVGNISGSHIRGYLKDPRVEIYAFCDIEPIRLSKMGDLFGVTYLYSSVDDMLADLPELDAVSVCVWNNAHAECAVKALRAGKHVLCEKPMALNTALAEEMQAAARASGKLLMIGFVRRFGDDAALMKEYRDEGFFGDIYYAKVKYLRRHGNPGGWFADSSRSGGGPLIDLGVHVIDLVCYIMGADVKPVSVYGATFTKLGQRPELKDRPGYTSSGPFDTGVCDVEDLATAMIRFSNGAVLHVEVSFALNLPGPENSLEIYGTKGGAVYAPGLTLCTDMNGHMVNVTPVGTPTEFDFDEAFARETRHFIDCIADGVPCRNPAEDGVRLMKILDAVYESARCGHEVLIGE